MAIISFDAYLIDFASYDDIRQAALDGDSASLHICEAILHYTDNGLPRCASCERQITVPLEIVFVVLMLQQHWSVACICVACSKRPDLKDWLQATATALYPLQQKITLH
jgi:hypothetical protein